MLGNKCSLFPEHLAPFLLTLYIGKICPNYDGPNEPGKKDFKILFVVLFTGIYQIPVKKTKLRSSFLPLIEIPGRKDYTKKFFPTGK